MVLTHFLGLIPLIILLIMSLVFYGKGLVHLTTVAYAATLGYMATLLQWEALFIPIVLFAGIIGIILFIYSMFEGGWL